MHEEHREREKERTESLPESLRSPTARILLNSSSSRNGDDDDNAITTTTTTTIITGEGLIVGFDVETTGISNEDIITVACVWSPCGVKVSCFHGEDFTPLLNVLDAAKYIYTFNGIDFDLPRLAKKCGRDMSPWVKKTVDPLYLMKGVLGFGACMKLDKLLMANGFECKSACGLEAIRFWNEGNLDALSSYCMDDARLTYELCAAPSITWGKWRVHLREARVVSFV
jgi:hypothetical protein